MLPILQIFPIFLHIPKIEDWVLHGKAIKVNYPDQTELIIETIINNEFHASDNYLNYLTNTQFDIAD